MSAHGIFVDWGRMCSPVSNRQALFSLKGMIVSLCRGSCRTTGCRNTKRTSAVSSDGLAFVGHMRISTLHAQSQVSSHHHRHCLNSRAVNDAVIMMQADGGVYLDSRRNAEETTDVLVWQGLQPAARKRVGYTDGTAIRHRLSDVWIITGDANAKNEEGEA